MKRIVFFLLMTILFSANCSAIEKTRIFRVESNKVDQYAEVIVHTSISIKPEIIVLDSPNRIALVFNHSSIQFPVTIPSKSPLINMVQVLQFDPDKVYVIIEPKDELSYDYASILGKNKFILELKKARPGDKKKIAPSPVISEEAVFAITLEAEPLEMLTEEAVVPMTPAEVSKEAEKLAVIEKDEISSTEVVKIPAAEIKKVTAKPVKKPVKQKVAIKPKLKTATTAETPTATPEVKEKALYQPLLGKTIVVDPGHGGRDPGYVGKSGILEKSLTMRVAIRLRKLLEQAGAKVILTRDEDYEVKNRKIVQIANINNADIFVAIHFNSYPSPYIKGCETYYFTQQSRKLALVMQKNVAKSVKTRSRGVKRVMYYTVHHTKMPAVLIEAGYLTNPVEEKKILTPAFRQQIALGIYKGLVEYVKIAP